MKRGLEEWVSIGERRIKSVLKKNIACSERQLQLKICEAGPYGQRLEPLVLNMCGDNLFRSGQMESKTITLNGNPLAIYFLKDTDEDKLDFRVGELTEWYKVYYSKVQCHSANYCGNVLESMIIDSIKDTNKYMFVANVYENRSDGVYVVQNCNMSVYNGKCTDSPLDSIAIIMETDIAIGVEIKNKTEWTYGSSVDIWRMIKKCCELDLLPIFVARKIPAITKFFFKKAGILGMETQFQYLHTSCSEELKDIIKKDKLGYAHVKFEAEYRDFMKKYFETVVIDHAEEYRERFQSNKSELYEAAKKLSNKSLNQSKRTKYYKEIRDIIYDKYAMDEEPSEAELQLV